MKLSDKILNLRKARQMSQEELAEKLGVSRQAVSRWEVGSALPDASNILQLSKLFGVTADYLLNDDYTGEVNTSKATTVKSLAGTAVKKIISLCVSAVGLLGNFIIYILSRFIEVPVLFKSYDPSDKTYYFSWQEGYSYRYFIEEHKLELISVIFWLMLIIGLFVAFVPKDKFMNFISKAKEFIKQKLPKKKSE